MRTYGHKTSDQRGDRPSVFFEVTDQVSFESVPDAHIPGFTSTDKEFLQHISDDKSFLATELKKETQTYAITAQDLVTA